jgi:hypothetical protein
MGPIHEGWYIFLALALLMVYLPWRWRHGGRVQGFEAYVSLLMILIPFWSAVAANREFGQPLIYGLLAGRGMVLAAGVPLLLQMTISRGLITFIDLKVVLKALAWFTLTLFLLMSFLLDPQSVIVSGTGFVVGSGDTARFVYDTTFIIFGFFYYMLKGTRLKSSICYLKAVPFFLFLMLVFQGRSTLLSGLAAYLILAGLWASNRGRFLRSMAKAVVGIGLIWVGLYFLNQGLFFTLVNKFSDAFTVVFKFELTDDPSANSRIEQIALAMPHIMNHWLVGNGTISNQWSGGFENVVGYFYPSDIGLIGVEFSYGVLGAILYSIQFKFALILNKIRNISVEAPLSLIQATKGQILFIGISSFSTGAFVHHSEVLLFFIGILWITSMRNPMHSGNLKMQNR